MMLEEKLPLTEGVYEVRVLSWQKGEGEHVAVTAEIIAGPFKGRHISVIMFPKTLSRVLVSLGIDFTSGTTVRQGLDLLVRCKAFVKIDYVGETDRTFASFTKEP